MSHPARHSAVACMVDTVHSALPASFAGDSALFGFNLFLMTAFMCLGLMLASSMVRALYKGYEAAAWRHPASIWRLSWLLAGAAVTLRCGTEAMNLWAWSPSDPVTTARVLMAKRWIDPVALFFTGGWMLLVILANAGIEEQLSKRPYPVSMWANLSSLRRPTAVAILSLVAAVGVACTR